MSVTTGAPEQAFGRDSLNGDILDILIPLQRGVLGFTGMSVLPPFVAYHVPYAGADMRASMLENWRTHLRRLDDFPPLAMPKLADHPGALDAATPAG